MSKTIKIGICGLGTVASGVVSLFDEQLDLLVARSGTDLAISHIGARRDNPIVDTSAFVVSRDIFAVAEDPEVDVLVELIGGTTTAYDLVSRALENGKHVVTANKALIAAHGNELFAQAEAQGVALRFEAAVAGGIPIIKTLRESLAGNRIDSVTGIINGTGNFILTEMAEKGREFGPVLEEAQALGYAEADPTFDVDGTDAAHKLVILASIAFGMPLSLEGLFTEGVDQVTPLDLDFARELGYRVKHLGIAQRQGERVDLRVHPTLIPEGRQIARVDGVLNAVTVAGNGVGEVVLVGPGAGSLPTASAVIGDIVDLCRELGREQLCPVPFLGVPLEALVDRERVPRGEVVTSWYLRLNVEDKPGVMAEITALLGAEGISIESLLQKPAAAGADEVSVVVLTDRASCDSLNRAVARIEALTFTRGPVTRLRVDTPME